MTVYQYQGRNERGQAISGQLDASSADSAANQLLSRGVTPVAIHEYHAPSGLMARFERWQKYRKVEPADLIMFCRQMYTVTKAGVPLVKGLRSLAASLRHLAFQETLNDIADRLETGMELSAAMRHHPRVFNNLFISLVGVGESSGRLDLAFLQLSEYLERDLATVKGIKAALRYPTFVLIFMAVAIAAINIWVIPAFANLFAQFGAQLPWPTRILIGISNFFVSYGWLLLIVVGLAIYGFFYYINTERGAYRWGYRKLRLPVVGDIIERASLARYARSFGLMARAGLPLPTALELCARAIDNAYLAEKIRGIRSGVERGEGLFHTHLASGIFSPLVLQMITVGEESGQVDELLMEVAGFYEREVEYDTKKLSERVQPILIVIMAGFVLILALGIFLPMWDLYAVQS